MEWLSWMMVLKLIILWIGLSIPTGICIGAATHKSERAKLDLDEAYAKFLKQQEGNR